MKDPHAFFAWHPPCPHETSGAKPACILHSVTGLTGFPKASLKLAANVHLLGVPRVDDLASYNELTRRLKVAPR